jgi:serine/threonine protein kinase
MRYVKICPVCGHKNQEAAAVCQGNDCDEFIAGIDPICDKGMFVDNRFLIEEAIPFFCAEADIFRCIDEHSGDPVIVKHYRINFPPKKVIVNELLNIFHPNLVRVIKYETWSGRFYEVMEYCAGGMLSNCVPMNVVAIRLLLPRIINGLSYLHSRNIIHRDIKPDNFFFRRPNMQELVIGDVGIRSLLACRKDLTEALTVDYTAPEIFNNKIYTESDYYALGIMLIHLFFGFSPFKDFVRWDAIIAAHMRGDIPNVEKIPADLQYIVSGLTQLKPSNRWGYSQVMQWLKGEQVLNDAGLPWKVDDKL